MEHLSSHELSGYLENSLDADDRERVELHLVECAACRVEVIDGRRALSSVTAGDEYRRRLSPLVPLAALAAAVALVAIWPREYVPAPPLTRAGETIVTPQVSTIDIVSPGKESENDASGIRFVWRRSGASTYRVTITDDVGRTLWSGSTPDTSIALPPGLILPPGGRFFWYVDALTVDGQSLTSGVNAFRISQ